MAEQQVKIYSVAFYVGLMNWKVSLSEFSIFFILQRITDFLETNLLLLFFPKMFLVQYFLQKILSFQITFFRSKCVSVYCFFFTDFLNCQSEGKSKNDD